MNPSSHDRPSISRRALGRIAAGTAIGLAAPAVIARAQPAALRLSNIQSITGPSAAYGWRARDGAQLAADQINAAGLSVGGTTYRLEIVVQDMANDPQQAITLLRQAASDSSIIGVIGPSNSVGFVPVVSAAGQLQIPMVGAGSGAPIKQWNPWSYRVNPVSSTVIPALLRKVHDKIAFKRLAVIYDQTQDGQSGDAQVCKTQAGQLGYEVVAFEAFRAGDADFSAQLAHHQERAARCALCGRSHRRRRQGRKPGARTRHSGANDDRVWLLPGPGLLGWHPWRHQGQLYLASPGSCVSVSGGEVLHAGLQPEVPSGSDVVRNVRRRRGIRPGGSDPKGRQARRAPTCRRRSPVSTSQRRSARI